jgi:nucleotide-binding universal stress UspA family protein
MEADSGAPLKKILVGVDGSDKSDEALSVALDMADRYGAEVTIIHVLEPTPIPSTKYPVTVSGSVESMANPEWVDIYYTKTTEAAKDLLNKSSEIATKTYPKLRVREKLAEGKPAEEIIKEARDGGYDLIVLGSHGLSNFEEFLLGSVSTDVVNQSKVSVLIVKSSLFTKSQA